MLRTVLLLVAVVAGLFAQARPELNDGEAHGDPEQVRREE